MEPVLGFEVENSWELSKIGRGGMLRSGRRGCLYGPGGGSLLIVGTCLCTNLFMVEKFGTTCDWTGMASSEWEESLKSMLVDGFGVMESVGTGSGNGYGLIIGSS